MTKPNWNVGSKFKKSKPSSPFAWIVTAIVIFIVLVIGWNIYYHYGTKHDEVLLIKDKITKRHGNDDQYLIFTDKGTFSDTDDFWNFKFDSSDVYGELEKGKTYKCTVNGFRVPIQSSYKNILDCEPLAQ